jgi:hypothetical protein
MPPTITYPTGFEYREALFNTRLCFKDPALVGGKVTLDSLGMPKPISGASASVFTIQSTDGRRWAVKCFTRFVDHQAVRYQRISETLKTVNKPWRVEFEYLPVGVLCKGKWYPALKMEWVDATGLISFIEAHLWEPDIIANLAIKFAQMVEDLSVLGIAHGDLQHGNLLVTSAGELKLIDYDGMFVPTLAQMGACEKGHVNYQSPARTMSTWGPYLDNFSTWIIYASLVALTIDPTLWSVLHDPGDEALLFHQQDFVDFRNSRAFHALTQNSQPNLGDFSRAMSVLWTPDLPAIPPLNPADLPTLGKQAFSSLPTSPAAATAGANTATGPIPDWVAQVQAGVGAQSAVPSSQGSASWVAGHLQALPLVVFNPSRLALRVLAAVALAAILTLGLCAGIYVVKEVVAGAASGLLASMFMAVTIALYRRTPEWRAKHEKSIILKESRAESSTAARERTRLEQARRDVDKRENKAVAEITKQADKAKASEQRELAGLNAKLAAGIQKIEKQKQSLRSGESKETGSALRLLQQQHVETHLRGATIRSAKITGIGPGVVSSLAANGITNAADFAGLQYRTGPRGGQQIFIKRRNGIAVHPSGVGERKANDLENWRRMVEGRAMATQPSSLPSAQALAIRAKYTQERQMLANQEQAARLQAADDQRHLAQKWATTHTSISGELVTTRQTFAQERAQVDLKVATTQKQVNTAVWQRELAEREVAAYRDVRYRRYIAGVIKT